MVAEAVTATLQPAVTMPPTVTETLAVKDIAVLHLSLAGQADVLEKTKRFLTYSRKANNVEVAYDVSTRRRVVLKTVAKTPESLPRLRKLIGTMRSLNGSAHTLQLLDVLDLGGQVTFVYEYLPHGDLADVIPADEGLGEEEALVWVRQIAVALNELHAAGYAHRDLKPDNIGVVRSKGQGPVVKLIDMDHAQHVSEAVLSKAVGTLPYMAPELLDDTPPDAVDLLAADMWAFGIIVFAIVTGRFPWSEASSRSREYTTNVGPARHMRPGDAARGSRRPIGPRMDALLRGVCAVDRRERWSAGQVVDHLAQ